MITGHEEEYSANENWFAADQKEDDVEKKAVVEQASDHNELVYNKKRTPKIISDRDFLGRVVWKTKGDGFVLVTSPEDNLLHQDAGGEAPGDPGEQRVT